MRHSGPSRESRVNPDHPAKGHLVTEDLTESAEPTKSLGSSLGNS